MISWLLEKVLGTKHDRELKKLKPRVVAIGELEPKISKLTDAQLRAKTAEFKEKLDNGASVDDIQIEAFAVAREAGKRALNMRHFDVQLIGGMVLNRGAIAEMRTGEGKTLVATLPAYLNALEGKGVHIVTVNDYLAKRDAEWMGRLYNFLGLTVGTVVHSQPDHEKFPAYRADITYGQNNEFGFDYLRDNMKYSIYDCVQRPLHYAIVDEVDSILVDEARTPLIISGQGEASTHLYGEINKVIPYLKKDEHYVLDEKGHSVLMTDEGYEEAERRLKIGNLHDPEFIEQLHVLQQCLRAHTLYKRDVNYMVTQDGKVNIIDEFTGRILPGRRWSDGLHQAVEAKEFVRVQEENRTLATITFQNLFRIYKKLGGMTGTAETEAEEFHSIYKLDVVPIPTNRSVQRTDYDDLVYKTEREKFKAVAEEIADCVERGQPSLVGTVSVAKSEAISALLKKRGIPHEVLNAKQHEREAYIVAQAGRRSAVTVATNMAGRGTDILLGGNPEMLAKLEMIQAQKDPNDPALKEEFETLVEKHKGEAEAEKKLVLEAGGLHIIGTERHESRRIDNQLRGRAGRQGDPGSSRFFLSLEDDLMRIFAGERVQSIMDSLGMEEDVPIEHPWVTRSVENAQKKVEARNFDIRKNLLEYDDVMNQQRKAVYTLRREVLEGAYSAALKNAEGDERDPRGLDADFEKRIEEACEQMVRQYPIAKTEVDAMFQAQKDMKPFNGSVPPSATLEGMEALNTAAVESAAYHYFGVRLDLSDHADNPEDAKKALVDAVSLSMRLQRERLLDVIDGVVVHLLEVNAPERSQRDDWNVVAIANQFTERFGAVAKEGVDEKADADVEKVANLLPDARTVYALIEPIGTREDMAHVLYDEAEKLYFAKEKDITPELSLRMFRTLVLEEIDRAWIDHLTNMDHLRDGIGLRGYGQKDPKLEFKKEGFDMFTAMMASVNAGVMQKLFHLQVQRQQDVERLEQEEAQRAAARARGMRAVHVDPQVAAAAAALGEDVQPEDPGAGAAPVGGAVRSNRPKATPSLPPGPPPPPPEQIESVRRAAPKVGRNDPCPCGSGKKYKKCHGATEAGTEA